MAKIALLFLLDNTSLPDNFGMKVSVEATAPLYEVLVRDCSLTKLSYPDSNAYCLRLFRKPFTTDLLVVEMDLDYHARDNIIQLCRNRAAEILKVKGDRGFFHEDYLHRAMWLPRGVAKQEFSTMVASFSGKTRVDPDQLPRLDSRESWIMSHPDGFILGGKNEADFLRSLVLYGLSMAYQLRIRQFCSQLSLAALTPGEQITTLLQDISRFMAGSYFSNPINPAARSDYAEYAHLARNMKFDELEQQLETKIRFASKLVAAPQTGSVPTLGYSESLPSGPRHDRSATAQHEKKPFNWLLLIVVLVVAAVALLFSAGLFSGGDYQQLLEQWFGIAPDLFSSTDGTS